MINHVDESTVFSQLKLVRSAFNGVLVLVEGGKDASILRKFLTKKAQVIVAHNKQNALTAGTRFVQEIDRDCIVFVDRDFDDLFEAIQDAEHLVYTDYHDLELHLVNSNGLKSVLHETLDHAKVKLDDFHRLDQLKRKLFPLSLLRFLSIKEFWNLFFDGFEISSKNFSSELDVPVLVDQIIHRTIHHLDGLIKEKPHLAPTLRERKSKLVSKATVHEKLAGYVSEGFDLDCFTNGHDVILLFSVVIKKVCIGPVRDYRAEDFERMLRVAYSVDDFRATGMYRTLSSKRPHVLVP